MLPHFHFHKLFKLKDEIHELYVNRSMRALAYSLIGVFIPLYLLNIGYSLDEILLYFFGIYATVAVFTPVVALMERKIGTKRTVSLSTFFTIILFAFLFTTEIYHWPIIIIFILQGVEHIFYWLPTNINFARYSKKGYRGRELGVFVSLPFMISVIAPVVGAWIIVSTSFDSLIIIAITIFISSSAVLYLTPEHKYSWKKVSRAFSKKNLNFFSLFWAKGAVYASILLWPVFIFLIFPDYIFVGSATTLAGIAAFVITLIVGFLTDKINKLKLLKFAAILNFLVWIIAIFVTDPIQAYAVSIFKGFALIPMALPAFSLACEEANKQNISEFFMFREIALAFGRCSLLIVAILMPDNLKFQSVFVISAIASLYFLFFRS